ncbi:MAG: hypothetical protein KDI01_10135 [Halioglobus sp.]|nr:hypothetical protein [Halioglobus sp.]
MDATEQQRRRNRMVLLMIAGIPLMVVLASTWLWYFVVRGDLDLVGVLGTANKGKLVQPPRRLDTVALAREDGGPFQFAAAEPQWTMLVPLAGGRCGQICEHSLYLTRQIHVAMGKEFNRLRRYYVGDVPVADTELTVQTLSDGGPAPASFADFVSTEHRGLEALMIDREDFGVLFAEHSSAPDTWYLVDPAGWIMMSYTGDTSYRDVMADLKFLLKNSSE